jgi:ABC-2 type transport system permease protein
MAVGTRAKSVVVQTRTLDIEAIYSIWLRDIKKFWRERSRLFGGIARPILWLLILGSSLKSAISTSSLGGAADYQQYIFPGVIGLTLVFSALQSATSIIWDREFGGATQATMQGIITLLFAPLIGLWLPPLAILELLVMMFVVALALTALGVVIASKMTSFEGFGTISNFVVMPMYFLSGAIYPTSTAPAWMKPLIIVNPLSYGVDALRHITVGTGAFPFLFDFAFLLVFAGVMIVVALPMFNRE